MTRNIHPPKHEHYDFFVIIWIRVQTLASYFSQSFYFSSQSFGDVAQFPKVSLDRLVEQNFSSKKEILKSFIFCEMLLSLIIMF